MAASELFNIVIPPVEAAIALSIVFLAWEIAKNQQLSLSLRFPVLVSSSFGLLQGFGFASVLADIGLSQNEKLLALVSFNIGVELGQLAFVAGLFTFLIILKKLYKPVSMDQLRLRHGCHGLAIQPFTGILRSSACHVLSKA